jgi:hypothetical protein
MGVALLIPILPILPIILIGVLGSMHFHLSLLDLGHRWPKLWMNPILLDDHVCLDDITPERGRCTWWSLMRSPLFENTCSTFAEAPKLQPTSPRKQSAWIGKVRPCSLQNRSVLKPPSSLRYFEFATPCTPSKPLHPTNTILCNNILER